MLLIEMVINGFMLGSIYALIAIGLSLLWGVMKVVNFAHGEFVMLGAYSTFWIWSLFNINPLLSIGIGLPFFVILSIVIHRGLIERIVSRGMMAAMMLTFGLSLILWNLAQLLWTTSFRTIDYLTGSWSLGPLVFSESKLVAFSVAIFLSLLLFAFLRYTKGGKAIRAVSQNMDLALACGIDTVRVRTLTFAISFGLASVAGSIIGLQWSIYPEMGFDYIPKAFAIVVLGGMGSILGAFLGAMILGLSEYVTTQVLTAHMAQAIPFVLILVILLVRPTGLFGVEVPHD